MNDSADTSTNKAIIIRTAEFGFGSVAGGAASTTELPGATVVSRDDNNKEARRET